MRPGAHHQGDSSVAEQVPARYPYAARIFDFDGTLVDTGDTNLRAVHAALTIHGVRAPLGWLRGVPLADLTVLRARLRDDLGASLVCSDQEIVSTARAYWLSHNDRLRPVEAVASAARAAAASGPVAVASANDGQIVRASLAVSGLAGLFAVVVAREDVARLKPAPDAFLAAASWIGCEPSTCLVYENTDDGITAAGLAGMDVIDVRATPWSICRPPGPV
ncbi:HAD family phosphatase [Kitasatospora sp. NPDC001603]|uniref:HAD family hydrolase n=1 Tax=Kitasatospora sp. NPDC001603 TaxID=3154388 RepID=UPI00331FCB5D